MSKEKFDEITELSDDIYNSFQHIAHSDGRNLAESLYNDGWRKQKEAEWISVEERAPERNGRYLTHCKIEGQSLVCILYYCNLGGFNEGTVTHWMPLPEPPKTNQ